MFNSYIKNDFKNFYIDMVNIMIVIFEKVYIWGLFFLVFGWLFSRIINNGLDVVIFYRWNRNSLLFNGMIIYILKFLYIFNLCVKMFC